MALTQVQPGMLGTPQPYNFKNRIINGAMVINQRGSTTYTLGTNTGGYTLDRWEYNAFTNTGAYTVTQSSTVPNGNFTNSTLLTVTATVSPTSTDYYFYQTKIEGYNMSDFGWGTSDAQTITISFWVRSSVTGTYSFHLINASINLSYIATYTINSANTWQYVTLTVPGPTTGTWNTTNGVGIYAGFDLGAGSSRQTTANTWSSGASFYCGTSSTTQWISNSGATFYVTGVQIEKGVSATTFDYRSIGTELQLCQRYCYAISGTGGQNNTIGLFVASSATTGVWIIPLPVQARVSPTGIVSNAYWGMNNAGPGGGGNNWSAVFIGATQSSIYVTNGGAGSSMTAGYSGWVYGGYTAGTTATLYTTGSEL